MRSGLFIGAGGWRYDDWRNGFYRDVPRKLWLKHYAKHFNAVEINTSFYGALQPATLERWRQETPGGFRFSIKANRFLTHVQRLRVAPASLARQRNALLPLGDKLAVVLWQLPKNFGFDPERLEAFTEMLKEWGEVRHALEFRDASWFCSATSDCLGRHRIAACQSDAADWPLCQVVTTDLAYLRLHGHESTYASAYSQSQLEAWAEKINHWLKENRQVHVYFDNTDAGHAPVDAMRLMAMLE